MYAYTAVKRPRVGDKVATGRYGVVAVTAVRDHGRVLTVATRLYPTETIERAERGHWARVACTMPLGA